MAVLPSTVGLTTVAGEMPRRKGFIYRDKFVPEDHMEGLWDELATESYISIVDEETGEPLGVTTGGSSTFSGFALVEDEDIAAFTGQVTIGPAGTLFAFEDLDIASFTGQVANVGSLIAQEANDTANFSGTVIDLATGSLIVQEALDIANFTATLGADVDMDFVNGIYVGANPTTGLTVTRNSISLAEDSNHDYIQFAQNQARITNLGLLIENASTNYITNNIMAGAGMPSPPPIGWTITSGGGLTPNIVGAGTENSVEYIDVAAQALTFSFEPLGNIPAVNGQSWTFSAFLKVVAGFLGAGTVKFQFNYYNSSMALLGSVSSPNLPVTGATLGSQRYVFEATAGVVGLAFIQPIMLVTGSGYNIRIGWPQMEQQSWASSPIRAGSPGVRVTRPTDIIKLTSLPVFSTRASLYGEGFLQGPSANKAILSFDDQSSANRMLIYTDGAGAFGFDTAGGIPIANLNIPSGWGTGLSAKAVFAVQPGTQNLVLNGSAPANSSSIGTVVPNGTNIWIGSQFGTTMIWEGRVKRIAVWRNAALSVLEMQQLTQ